MQNLYTKHFENIPVGNTSSVLPQAFLQKSLDSQKKFTTSEKNPQI